MSSYEDICKQMKNKTDEFSKYLKHLNDLNNEVRERTEKILQTLSEVKGKKKQTCSVCYTAQPTHAFLTCGHVHCLKCAERGLTRNKCFQCRSPVESILRVYV